MPVAAPIAGGLAAGAASSLLSKGGGGGGGTTTQNTDPWVGVQPHLSELFRDAAAKYQGGAYNYLGNQSPFTQQAQALTAQRAMDPNSLIGRSQSMLGGTIAGNYLTPDSNPYLKASVEDALGLAGSSFAKQYGGPAGQNLGNSGYQESLARGLGATATNAYANAYGQERQNQLNASQLAPSMDFANLQALAGVGAQQEALQQQQFNAPWENLQRYQSLISGQPGGSQSSPYFTNPLANAMGLGLGGMTLLNGMGGYSGLGNSLFGAFGGGARPVPEMVAGQYGLTNPQYG